MLKQGDTIGIVALAGDCEKEKIDLAVKNIESMGYNIKLASNILSKNRYLAGNDTQKINELHNFFEDPNIKLILNARGGYGSIRLINKIDYEIIKNNPKPFCGFSDITALLLMFYKKTGLITYHSPMLCSDFVNINNFTINSFFDALNNNKLEFNGNKIYKDGTAKGILWGGNLSTIASLCGQDFIPEDNFIFFVEDLNEPAYKIDKMFTQLFNIKTFKSYCKGIVLGDFLDVDNNNFLEELFYEFEVPTVSGFKISHNTEKITLPIGKLASLKNYTLNVG